MPWIPDRRPSVRRHQSMKQIQAAARQESTQRRLRMDPLHALQHLTANVQSPLRQSHNHATTSNQGVGEKAMMKKTTLVHVHLRHHTLIAAPPPLQPRAPPQTHPISKNGQCCPVPNHCTHPTPANGSISFAARIQSP